MVGLSKRWARAIPAGGRHTYLGLKSPPKMLGGESSVGTPFYISAVSSLSALILSAACFAVLVCHTYWKACRRSPATAYLTFLFPYVPYFGVMTVCFLGQFALLTGFSSLTDPPQWYRWAVYANTSAEFGEQSVAAFYYFAFWFLQAIVSEGIALYHCMSVVYIYVPPKGADILDYAAKSKIIQLRRLVVLAVAVFQAVVTSAITTAGFGKLDSASLDTASDSLSLAIICIALAYYICFACFWSKGSQRPTIGVTWLLLYSFVWRLVTLFETLHQQCVISQNGECTDDVTDVAIVLRSAPMAVVVLIGIAWIAAWWHQRVQQHNIGTNLFKPLQQPVYPDTVLPLLFEGTARFASTPRQIPFADVERSRFVSKTRHPDSSDSSHSVCTAWDSVEHNPVVMRSHNNLGSPEFANDQQFYYALNGRPLPGVLGCIFAVPGFQYSFVFPVFNHAPLVLGQWLMKAGATSPNITRLRFAAHAIAATLNLHAGGFVHGNITLSSFVMLDHNTVAYFDMRSSQPRQDSQVLSQSDVRGLATTVLSVLLGSEAPQKRVTQQMLVDAAAQFDGPVGPSPGSGPGPGTGSRLLCSGQRMAEAIAGALGLTTSQPGGQRGSLLTRAQPFNEAAYQASELVVVHSPLAGTQTTNSDVKASSLLRGSKQSNAYDTPSSYTTLMSYLPGMTSDRNLLADRRRQLPSSSSAPQSTLQEFWNEFCSALYVDE